MSISTSTGWPVPASIYLHVPFCPYKCFYCDFVTYVNGERLIPRYVTALEEEIRRLVEGKPRLETIYIGGGTPAMLSPTQIHGIIEAVNTAFTVHGRAEISIEANPGEIGRDSLSDLRFAGVNRVSFGAQSMSDRELVGLGRGHRAADVARAVTDARAAGLDSVALDLIYGIPEQTLESWRETLNRVVNIGPDQVSLYTLIVEPRTRFHRLSVLGQLGLPDDDSIADMYELACDVLGAAGYLHEEVATWATAGAFCRHNLNYWHNHEFWAAGVGAYDYLRPYRSTRGRQTNRYVERIESGLDPIARRDLVDEFDERFETVVMGLRLLREGLTRERYEQRFGESLNSRFGLIIQELVSMNLLADDGNAIRIPEDKVMIANEIWERFLPDRVAESAAGSSPVLQHSSDRHWVSEARTPSGDAVGV
jgi:oxygen-independent coproporphyrinogen-3 oxidase